MRIKIAGVFLALCPVLLAQVVPQEPKITKIIHVHGNATAIASLAGHGWDMGTIGGDTNLKAVVVHARPADAAEIEKAVVELDAISSDSGSRKDVEVVAYLVGGSMGTADSGTEILAPVYKQMHAIFPYKSYQLLTTMLLRSDQNREASASGILKSFQGDPDIATPSTYHLRYDSALVSTDTSPMIHLTKLQFGATIPVPSGVNKGSNVSVSAMQYRMVDIGIETNVDLHEGQKVVVGTSNVDPAGTTLFLVVTARLL